MIESKSAWKRLKKLMLENQILHNQFLDSFDQIFDLIHSIHKPDQDLMLTNHKAAQEPGKQSLTFCLKNSKLKTGLEGDSRPYFYPITFLKLQGRISNQNPWHSCLARFDFSRSFSIFFHAIWYQIMPKLSLIDHARIWVSNESIFCTKRFYFISFVFFMYFI